MQTLPILFKLKQFQPDKSQYQVCKSLFEPVVDFIVVVEIPLERQYIYNIEEILMAQIGGNKHNPPIYTPEGLYYVEQILLSRIDSKDEDDNNNPDNIEWESD